MMSYRFARRSFLRGVGGAVGLKVMLRNLEASAQGATSPPRLLITHWPVGTVRPDFLPTATSNTSSPILKPFGDAGLGADMTVFFGLSTQALPLNGGGGHEGGTVVMMTGVGAPGTRSGETEADDAYAGGPSIDQILLRHVTSLQKKGNSSGTGYENAICDSRVDFAETSTQCLSYGYSTQPVARVPQGTTGTEAVPLLPTLRPLDLFTNLFGSFMGGGAGGAGGNTAEVTKTLRERKSVLDFCLRELNQLNTLAPASERNKIDIHAQSIRAIETQVSMQLAGTGGPVGACTPPMMPPTVSGGASDKLNHNNYGDPRATAADDTIHAQIGALHAGIIKAAFVCDIIRVATFQWSPGTNHVAFLGQYPNEPTTIYQHHPLSHKIITADTMVAAGGTRRPEVQFLSNVQTWYNLQMAKILTDWKGTTDAMGGNLLEHTVIPFVTEVAATGHEHTNMPAMLFGGRALGFQHGRFMNFTPNRPLNDLWLTVAQAFGLSPTAAPLNADAMILNRNGWTGPIAGLWTAPV